MKDWVDDRDQARFANADEKKFREEFSHFGGDDPWLRLDAKPKNAEITEYVRMEDIVNLNDSYSPDFGSFTQEDAQGNCVVSRLSFALKLTSCSHQHVLYIMLLLSQTTRWLCFCVSACEHFHRILGNPR